MMIKDEFITLTKLRVNIIIPKLKKTLLPFGSYLKLPALIPMISSQLTRPRFKPPSRFKPQQSLWEPPRQAGNSHLMLPQLAPQISPLWWGNIPGKIPASPHRIWSNRKCQWLKPEVAEKVRVRICLHLPHRLRYLCRPQWCPQWGEWGQFHRHPYPQSQICPHFQWERDLHLMLKIVLRPLRLVIFLLIY